MASTTGQVAYKSKPGQSRHLTYSSASLRFRLWRGGVSSSFISLMWYFWFSLDISAFMDWHLGGGLHFLRDHFVQFTYSAGDSRVRRSFLQLIWLACVWVVWTERNHKLFRGTSRTPIQMLDKIKLYSFRWLKATNVTLASNCHSWWSSPRLCLGFV